MIQLCAASRNLPQPFLSGRRDRISTRLAVRMAGDMGPRRPREGQLSPSARFRVRLPGDASRVVYMWLIQVICFVSSCEICLSVCLSKRGGLTCRAAGGRERCWGPAFCRQRAKLVSDSSRLSSQKFNTPSEGKAQSKQLKTD